MKVCQNESIQLVFMIAYHHKKRRTFDVFCRLMYFDVSSFAYSGAYRQGGLLAPSF